MFRDMLHTVIVSGVLCATLVPGNAFAQERRHGVMMGGQDTTAQARDHALGMGMHRMRMPMMGHGPGAGFPLAVRTAEPGFLLSLHDELGLTDEQAGRLQGIRDALQERAKSLGERMHEAHRSVVEADSTGDLDALQGSMSQAIQLHGEMAGAHLQAARDALAVLTGEQRDLLQSWRRGFRVLSRRLMRAGHPGERPGEGRGMDRRHHRREGSSGNR